MYRTHPAPPLKITRPVVVSLLLHLALFASLAIVPGLRLPISEKPMRVTWVELPKGTSEDIDLNIKKSEGMPKSTIEEQKNAPIPEQPPKQEPLVATKPPEAQKLAEAKKTEVPRPKMEITDKNTKVRRADQPPKPASDRKIQNALAKIDQQLKERTVVPEAAQVKESGGGYKYGTSDKPLRVSPSDPEYLKYQAMLRYKIMREWIVPATYADAAGRMNAKVEVMINMDGEVVSVQWASASGNASFDQSAVRAVKKASPFPKPPDRLAWEAYNEGFLVEFDPRMKAQY